MPRPGRTLAPSFFARPTLIVAREILGATLVHDTADGRVAGRIVEVEAYVGESDPGCHASSGPTARNLPLYGAAGSLYVYLNYGVHALLNVVTEFEGQPAAVLIRAVEPLEGIPLMRHRRGSRAATALEDAALCRGPGNLSKAFAVTLRHNRTALADGPLAIHGATAVRGVRWTRRIGLSKGSDRYWRCAVAGSPAVSGRRAWNADARLRPWPARAVADVRPR